MSSDLVVQAAIMGLFFGFFGLLFWGWRRYLIWTGLEKEPEYKEEQEDIPDDVMNKEVEKILEPGTQKTPLWATILTIIILLVIVIYAISVLK